jgi:ABC-type hemin transport system ATPase subunit
MSVKTYVKKLVESIGRGVSCSHDNAILLKSLVDYIASASILEFDQTMYRKLSGGRRRRMQTKRNKKTKRNNKRTNKR